jgi:hypothetical protein
MVAPDHDDHDHEEELPRRFQAWHDAWCRRRRPTGVVREQETPPNRNLNQENITHASQNDNDNNEAGRTKEEKTHRPSSHNHHDDDIYNNNNNKNHDPPPPQRTSEEDALRSARLYIKQEAARGLFQNQRRLDQLLHCLVTLTPPPPLSSRFIKQHIEWTVVLLLEVVVQSRGRSSSRSSTTTTTSTPDWSHVVFQWFATHRPSWMDPSSRTKKRRRRQPQPQPQRERTTPTTTTTTPGEDHHGQEDAYCDFLIQQLTKVVFVLQPPTSRTSTPQEAEEEEEEESLSSFLSRKCLTTYMWKKLPTIVQTIFDFFEVDNPHLTETNKNNRKRQEDRTVDDEEKERAFQNKKKKKKARTAVLAPPPPPLRTLASFKSNNKLRTKTNHFHGMMGDVERLLSLHPTNGTKTTVGESSLPSITPPQTHSSKIKILHEKPSLTPSTAMATAPRRVDHVLPGPLSSSSSCLPKPTKPTTLITPSTTAPFIETRVPPTTEGVVAETPLRRGDGTSHSYSSSSTAAAAAVALFSDDMVVGETPCLSRYLRRGDEHPLPSTVAETPVRRRRRPFPAGGGEQEDDDDSERQLALSLEETPTSTIYFDDIQSEQAEPAEQPDPVVVKPLKLFGAIRTKPSTTTSAKATHSRRHSTTTNNNNNNNNNKSWTLPSHRAGLPSPLQGDDEPSLRSTSLAIAAARSFLRRKST